MKIKILKPKFKIPKVPKPVMFDDETYLRWQRFFIIYGLPILIIGLITHFFMNPQLPLKSVMWSSALGSACYIMAVSMIRPGTKRFWLLFIYFFSSGTIHFYLTNGNHAYQQTVDDNAFLSFIFSFGVLPIFYFICTAIFTDKDQQKVQSRFRFMKKIRLKKRRVKS